MHMHPVVFLFLSLFVAGSILSIVTWALLRRRHPAVWRQIVAPVAERGYGPIRMSLRRLCYVFRGEYRQIDDPSLVSMFLVLKYLMVMYIVLFCVVGLFITPK